MIPRRVLMLQMHIRTAVMLAVFVGSSGIRRKYKKGNRKSAMPPSLSSVQSFGLIDEPNDAWLRRKQVHVDQMAREQKIWDHVDGNTGHVFFQSHHEPSFHCEDAQRIGNTGDGGKWVCDPYKLKEAAQAGKSCLVYSVGSHGEFDFEQGVQTLVSDKCEIHIFDPDPSYADMTPKGMSYHTAALGNAGQVVRGYFGSLAQQWLGESVAQVFGGTPAKSMAQIAKELGHSGRTLDLLKIDCEGCEWDTFSGWLDAGLDIRQIMVELHWRNDPRKVQKFFKSMYDHGYVVFSKEPNTEYSGGDCVEYSFLKLDPTFGKSRNA